MASVSKSFLADAGYGEQELDANAALMELDKGLRSGKLGEQCEAAVRFPRLFQKYPFPILINSAFLKLAEFFRVGNNFLRLCILKMTQQSEKHLEKILNVDEFVKKIFSVIHSNDPVARAITLRMLGSMASIIPERKNAHHSIRQSLDSHDNVEVEAAIFAAANFSAQSKDFAGGICNKISEMIQGLATPVDLKLKLIPILQHMHHDANLASSARQLLQQLVTSYPSTKMVIVTLHTFTLLAASSLVDIPKQIELLLQYMKNDPREAALCECALQTPYDSLKLGMLSVLSTLSDTIAIKQYFSIAPGTKSTTARSSDLVKLAQESCYHNNQNIAAHGVRVLTNIAASCQEKEPSSSPKATLKLAKSRPHLSQSIVESLLTQLPRAQDAAKILICHCLAAIAMQLPVLGDGMLGDLMNLYKVIGCSAANKQQELLVSLATVIFVASQKTLSSEVKAVIKQQLENDSNGWTAYRIARQASRMGNHGMAKELYQSLLTQAASTPLNPLSFQCGFVKLRIDLLQAFSQLICTCNSLKTSPPPAIATTIAMTSGNDLQRCGHETLHGRIQKPCSKIWRSLSQQSCLLISHAIEALILDPESASEYERRMMSVFGRVLEEVEALNRKYAPHTACLCSAVIALLKVPLSFQRYFFQKLQSTSIKLALSPRNPAEPIVVQNNQQLALKIEGVVQHGSKPGLFRKIQSICLNVSSTLQSKPGQEYKIPIDNLTNEMEQMVEPHNDYFSTQFLLNFIVVGTHSITVESSGSHFFLYNSSSLASSLFPKAQFVSLKCCGITNMTGCQSLKEWDELKLSKSFLR
ncbi:Integrator complex subunit 7, partial [Ophiophagus hannah]